MRWRSEEPVFERPILSDVLVRRYRALRAEKRIGILWVEQGQYFLGEIDGGYRLDCAEWISYADLVALILSFDRKPVEAAATKQEDVKRWVA